MRPAVRQNIAEKRKRIHDSVELNQTACLKLNFGSFEISKFVLQLETTPGLSNLRRFSTDDIAAQPMRHFCHSTK